MGKIQFKHMVQKKEDYDNSREYFRVALCNEKKKNESVKLGRDLPANSRILQFSVREELCAR